MWFFVICCTRLVWVKTKCVTNHIWSYRAVLSYGTVIALHNVVLSYGLLGEKPSKYKLTVTLPGRLDLDHHSLLASWSLHHTLITVWLSVRSTHRAIVSSTNLWTGTLSLSIVRDATDGIRIWARIKLTGIQGWKFHTCKNKLNITDKRQGGEDCMLLVTPLGKLCYICQPRDEWSKERSV